MSVSISDVRRVAALARLDIDDAHLATYAGELDRILQHMDVLQAVEITVATERTITDGPAKATRSVATAAPLRDDTGDSVPLERDIRAFAPSERDGFFLVPRLSTHE